MLGRIADVGKKGGTSEYIKDGPKSGVVKKRSFVAPSDLRRRKVPMNDYTDYLIDQLALVRNCTRGDVVAEAVLMYALAYRVARDLSLDMLAVLSSIQDILNSY